MLTYKEFCTKVHDEIPEYLPNKGRGYVVSLNAVNKVNLGMRDALVFREKGSVAAPSIYLSDYYNKYKEYGGSVEDIMTDIAREVTGAKEETMEMKAQLLCDMDYSQLKDMVYVSAIGAERNGSLLETIPHKQMGDICAVYRIHLDSDRDRRATVLITNPMLERMGVSVATYYRRFPAKNK